MKQGGQNLANTGTIVSEEKHEDMVALTN